MSVPREYFNVFLLYRDAVMILLAKRDATGTAQRRSRRLKRRMYRNKG